MRAAALFITPEGKFRNDRAFTAVIFTTSTFDREMAKKDYISVCACCSVFPTNAHTYVAIDSFKDIFGGYFYPLFDNEIQRDG